MANPYRRIKKDDLAFISAYLNIQRRDLLSVVRSHSIEDAAAPGLARLSVFCKSHCNLDLIQLCAMAERYVRLTEACRRLGVARHRPHYFRVQFDIPLLIGAQGRWRPMFIEERQISSIIGRKRLADWLCSNPIYRWRADNYLFLYQCCDKLNVSRSELAKLELGKLIPSPRSKLAKAIRRECGRAAYQELVKWKGREPFG